MKVKTALSFVFMATGYAFFLVYIPYCAFIAIW